MNGGKKRWRKSLAICGVALALGAATGCDTGPIAARMDSTSTYPEVSLSQESLRDALAFLPPVVGRVDNGLLRVTVPVRSKADEALHVEYRVTWFDATGQALDPEMTWAPLRLEPRQPASVTVTATSDLAARYNVQFRWGKR